MAGKRDRRSSWIPLLGAAAPIAAALAASGRAQLFLLLLGVVLALLLVVERMLQGRPPSIHAPHLPPLPPGWKVSLGRRLRAAGSLLAGAAVVAAGWVLVPLGWDAATGSSRCPDPTELRVMAAPENLRATRSAVAGFTAAQRSGERCVPVRVTVFGAPSPSRLKAMFEGTWDLSQGIHPDVYLPASSASIEGSDGSAARLRIDRRTGQPSPLVLAVPERVNGKLQLYGSEAGTWQDLVERLDGAHTDLLLPDPDATESGLAGVFALFTGNDGDTDAARQARHRIIGLVNRDHVTLAQPDDVLCRLQALSAQNQDQVVAAVVPWATVQAFNSGNPCGAASTRDVQRLIAVQPADGTPALDHPVVRVTWRGDHDPVRDRFAAEFGRWLMEHSPLPAPPHSPGTPITAAQLDEGHDLLTKARKPLLLEFMFDLSATMRQPTSTGTLLSDARTFADDALGRLGGTDEAGLWSFPDTDTGREPTRLVARAATDDAQVGRLRQRLAGIRRASATWTPLYHAISVAARHDKARERTLVVLTDGVNDEDPRYDPVTLRQELTTALADADSPRVYVIALADKGCGADLRELQETTRKFQCLDGERTGGRLLNGLFAELTKEG